MRCEICRKMPIYLTNRLLRRRGRVLRGREQPAEVREEAEEMEPYVKPAKKEAKNGVNWQLVLTTT
jgi:hypothetical protein